MTPNCRGRIRCRAKPLPSFTRSRPSGCRRSSPPRRAPRLVDSDVVVTNGSGNHAPNIAEHLLALMLAFARQLPALIRSQQAARWEPPESSRLFELSGQTLAIVGAGAIGSALAPRAAA